MIPEKFSAPRFDHKTCAPHPVSKIFNFQQISLKQKNYQNTSKSSISYFMSHVTRWKPSKNRYYRSIEKKKFEKIRKSTFRVFDYLSNKKKSSKLVQWLVTEQWSQTCHDEQTDRQRADTTIFNHRFFKILDFRSVRFASRNITPLEDYARYTRFSPKTSLCA